MCIAGKCISLQQLELFKYFGVAFTIAGKQNKKIDTRITKTNCVVLRELHCPLWSKNKHRKSFQFLNQVFVLMLTYSHKSWVMTERVISHVQTAEMVSLQSSQSDVSRQWTQL